MPHDLAPASSAILNDPLNANTHALNAGDPWSNRGSNYWPASLNNIQFTSNTTPNSGLTPRGVGGLTFGSDGFAGSNVLLGATVAADCLSIVCESPSSLSVQGMALELVGSGSFRVRVHFESGNGSAYQSDAYVNVLPNQKLFLAFIKTRILRVDVWSTSGGIEGIASISVHRRPRRLDVVGNDNVVNVSDLLAVISAWGSCVGCPATPCAADVAPSPAGDCTVNVSDLLAIISAWGPLSPPKECTGEDPSTGNCNTDDACGTGVCDTSTCVPSACICNETGQWICTIDCCGRCI